MAPLLIETFESERDRGLSLSVLADFSKDLSLFLSLSLSLSSKKISSLLFSPSQCLPLPVFREVPASAPKTEKKRKSLKNTKPELFFFILAYHTHTRMSSTPNTPPDQFAPAPPPVPGILITKVRALRFFFVCSRARARFERENCVSWLRY